MRRKIRPKQFDLFQVPATAPPSALPAVRTETVHLLCALLLEVMSQQQSQPITVVKEPNHEQDHA